MGRKVFISYSHRDTDECKKLAGILKDKMGLDVWFDRGLNPGEKYRERIAGEIKNSDYFVILLSNTAVESEWVQDELEYAKKKQIEIIPIMLPGTELPDAFDMMIQRYNIIPYEKEPLAMEQAFRKAIPAYDMDEKGPEKQGDSSKKDFRKKKKLEDNKDKEPKQKKKKKSLWLLVALIPLIIVAAFVIRSKYMKQEIKTVTDILPNSMFWGEKAVAEDRISSLTLPKRLRTWKMDDKEYELSDIPFYIEVNPQNDAGVMILGFVDKNGKKYYTYGEYSCCNATLYRKRESSTVPYTVEDVVVSPCDKSDFKAGNKNLLHLGEEVRFKLRLNMNGYLYIQSPDSEERVEIENCSDGREALFGKAVSEQDRYDDILFFYVDKERKTAQIIYTDGGYAISATGNIYDNIHTVSMRADERMTVYNGSPTKENKYQNYSFHYVDTFPYGCIFIEDEKCYCYQNAEGVVDSEILSTGGLDEGDPRQFLKSVGLMP